MAAEARQDRDVRAHLAGRLEDAWAHVRNAWLSGRAWRAALVPLPSYGTTDWIRVRGRVLLVSPTGSLPTSVEGRGWRAFRTAEVPGALVRIHIGRTTHDVVADRSGYVDAVLPATLPTGWQSIRAEVASGGRGQLPVLVVDGRARVGIISDIDDTILTTMVPRPLLAAYNMLLRPERQRLAVRGMPEFYAALRAEYPTAPVFYVSNGAWNLAGTLGRFLARSGLPAGPMLLTDFGPTSSRWFRSGREHKRDALRRLAAEFPHLDWILVGDDGQADPQLYREFAQEHPGRVRLVAIRRLGPARQVISTPGATPASRRREMNSLEHSSVRVIQARTGFGLAKAAGLHRVTDVRAVH